ncbi:iron-containing redox enzyme family protein [Kocuria atrinae]|uniref:iron-containing redox enzyme family protein n=1 Tax=Kocuria atrinae TaxID=592377 RepID=UPI0003146C10|nr:iron-containing redox enzyme family protein [Kocuria atrinae]
MSSALISLLVGDHETTDGLAHLAAATDRALAESQDLLTDEDLQLSLFLLYLLHYGPAEFVRGEWEWDPDLIRIRGRIEQRFEAQLRAEVELPAPLPRDGKEAAEALFAMTQPAAKPSTAMWLAKNATEDLLREFLIQRSIYTLREADPHTWSIPKLQGRAKAAMVEIQADEYGGGHPDKVHSEIFARTMRNIGLDDTPDAYLDLVPASTLASTNLISMFGLNRCLRGANVGHLAAFEMTSTIPNKHYGNAFRKRGYRQDVTWYFDEHVEADAVHEQLAARDLVGNLVDDEPQLTEDIFFGAAACLYVDGHAGDQMLEAWMSGRSSLLTPEPRT